MDCSVLGRNAFSESSEDGQHIVTQPSVLPAIVQTAVCSSFDTVYVDSDQPHKVMVSGPHHASIDAGGDVMALAGGNTHFLALRKDGSVVVWGENASHGRFGLGLRSSSDVYDPRHLVELEDIVEIDCGDDHSVALTEQGQVWSWGKGKNYRLGLRTEKDLFFPTLIPTLRERIQHVSCGSAHTLMIGESGALFTMGSNEYGQCGSGLRSASIGRPRAVLEDVIAVAAGGGHSIAIQVPGTVYTFGLNSHGQLGASPHRIDTRSVPKQLPMQEHAVSTSAGALHSAIVTVSGQVWTFGHGRYGQLGNGKTDDEHTPHCIQGLSPVCKVSCGRWHTMIMEGKPYAPQRRIFPDIGDVVQEENEQVFMQAIEEQASFFNSLLNLFPMCRGPRDKTRRGGGGFI